MSSLFDVLHAGWRSVTSGKAWAGGRGDIGDRDRFGIGGYVRVIEATVSRPGSGGHGWHLHAHCLVFTMGGLEVGIRGDVAEHLEAALGYQVDIDTAWLGRVALHARIAQRWARGVERAGGRSPGAAAVDLVTIEDGGAEFVGRYLAKGTLDVAARLGAEVAAGDLTKNAREAANVSPFGLLAELIADGPRFGIRTPRRWEIASAAVGFDLIDLDSGEVTSITPPSGWALWAAWEQATRGRRQMAWALMPRRSDESDRAEFWRALLAVRGDDADATDEDLASREVDGDLLALIPRSAWYARLVWRPGWLVDLLEAAEDGGAPGLRAWCREHGVEVTEQDDRG